MAPLKDPPATMMTAMKRLSAASDADEITSPVRAAEHVKGDEPEVFLTRLEDPEKYYAFYGQRRQRGPLWFQTLSISGLA